MNLLNILEKHYGYSAFRPGQEEIINKIMNGQDVLGILPTGGGKSVCYQVPAVALDGVTLVISPLISLMKDQVDTLNQLAIPALYINSTLSNEEYLAAIRAIRKGSVKLVYIAPERLANDYFINLINEVQVPLIAIDEAHCVSQWGHDFRQSYRQIQGFIEQLNKRPIIAAFTATATKLVQEDIVDQLGLKQPQVFINSFDRPNIKFTVKEPVNKMRELVSYLQTDDAIIIYAKTRKEVDRIQNTLCQQGYRIERYHAGMTAEERQVAQDNFILEKSQFIVATNAFGMGIDKTDVRKVIHYNMPTDLESYYQEAGRAGRDSLPSEAILFFARQDIVTAKQLIADSVAPHVEERLQAMINYASSTTCLRKQILSYFGQTLDQPCMNCSACLDEFQTTDVTKEGQMLVSAVVRMHKQAGFSFGMTMLVDHVRGKSNDKMRQYHLTDLSTFGLLESYSDQMIKAIISQLISADYLNVNAHRGIELGPLAMTLLKGDQTVYIKEVKESKKPAKRSTPVRKSLEVEEDDLYERLRELRYKLAQEEGVPAYIIFNNNSLIDMANKKPQDYVEFLEIEGVGDIKAEKYWEAFTEVILEYLDA